MCFFLCFFVFLDFLLMYFGLCFWMVVYIKYKRKDQKHICVFGFGLVGSNVFFCVFARAVVV